MGRIIIDLPDEDLRMLDTIKSIQKRPRAEIIRQAIGAYLATNRIEATENAFFGIWQRENGDGLDFQTNLREEWK